MHDEILADLYALSGLNTQTRKLGEAVDEVVHIVESEIRRITRRIEAWIQECQQQVRRCQSALAACERTGTEEHPPDCSAEARALAEAQARLQRAQKVQNQLRQVTDDYNARARRVITANKQQLSQISQLVTADISTGTAYLSSQIRETGQGLETFHDNRYQRARREYFLRLLESDDTPDDIRGWIQQERNRGQLRNPPDLDVCHRLPGLHIPENFVLNSASYNRRLPHVVRQYLAGLGAASDDTFYLVHH